MTNIFEGQINRHKARGYVNMKRLAFNREELRIRFATTSQIREEKFNIKII